MSIIDKLHYAAVTASGLASFFPTVWKSGIVNHRMGVGALVHTPSILARYWLSTAREVEQASLICPERLALIDDVGTLSYRQLRDEATTFARYLHELPVDEIRLGIMARNGRGIITPLVSKGFAGATVFLLNIGSSAEQLAGCIAENNINVLVIDDEFLDRVPEDPSQFDIDGDVHVVVGDSTHGVEHKFDTLADIVSKPEKYQAKLPLFPRHGNIVLMSSGTTGIPKGIIRPELKLPIVLTSLLKAMPWKIGMTVQMTASMFHTWGWGMTNIAFAARATIVTRRVFDPEACLRDIQRYSCDALISSPVFYKDMVALENTWDYDISSLVFIASSGHALTPGVAAAATERFGPILCNVYGSTELTLASTATAEQIAEDPTIGGEVAAGTILRILDDNGKEVPQGQVGKIYLRNATTMIGYSNPDIPLDRVGQLQAIGDLGYIDSEGMLHVLGRADDMIIVGGENVYPASVDNVLDTMPGIADHHAAGVSDDKTFSRIAVWVVKADDDAGKNLSADDIRDWIDSRLAGHSVPRDVHFVDDLPRNATGKVVPRLLEPQPS